MSMSTWDDWTTRSTPQGAQAKATVLAAYFHRQEAGCDVDLFRSPTLCRPAR
jgi:hypothetical protein